MSLSKIDMRAAKCDCPFMTPGLERSVGCVDPKGLKNDSNQYICECQPNKPAPQSKE